jgi:hypothetical protein
MDWVTALVPLVVALGAVGLDRWIGGKQEAERWERDRQAEAHRFHRNRSDLQDQREDDKLTAELEWLRDRRLEVYSDFEQRWNELDDTIDVLQEYDAKLRVRLDARRSDGGDVSLTTAEEEKLESLRVDVRAAFTRYHALVARHGLVAPSAVTRLAGLVTDAYDSLSPGEREKALEDWRKAARASLAPSVTEWHEHPPIDLGR